MLRRDWTTHREIVKHLDVIININGRKYIISYQTHRILQFESHVSYPWRSQKKVTIQDPSTFVSNSTNSSCHAASAIGRVGILHKIVAERNLADSIATDSILLLLRLVFVSWRCVVEEAPLECVASEQERSVPGSWCSKEGF